MSIAPTSLLQEHLQGLSEAALQTCIIEPLLRASGFDHVRDVSGPGEKGKDLVAFRRELGSSLLYAIQIKKIRITGAIATTRSIIALVQQLYQAIRQDHFDPATKSTRPVDRLMFITPYTIDRATFDSAAQSIQDLARHQITIIDGPTLISEAVRLIPDSLISLDESIGYRAALAKELDEIQESVAFGIPRHLSADQLFVEVGLQIFESVATIIASVLQQRERHWDSVRKGHNTLQLPSLTGPQVELLGQAIGQWSKTCNLVTASAQKKLKATPEPLPLNASDPSISRQQNPPSTTSPETIAAVAFTTLRQCVVSIYHRHKTLASTCPPDHADQLFMAIQMLQQSLTNDVAQAMHDSWALLNEPEIRALNEAKDTISAGRNTLNSQVLHQTQHPLLIVGPPGAGKTTLLRMITSRSAKHSDIIEPVFIRAIDIRSLSPDGILLSAVESMRTRGSAIGHDAAVDAFAGGRLRVVIDGLDEVGDRIRQLRAGILSLVRIHPKASLVISVRDTIGFEEWRSCVTIGLYPFNNGQLCNFIDNWFSAEPASADGLKKWILGRPHLLECARTPIIAALLCALHRPGSQPPETEVELYAARIELLCRGWDRAKGIIPLPSHVVTRYVAALRDLAHDAHTQGIRTFDVGHACNIFKRYTTTDTGGTDQMVQDCVHRSLLAREPGGRMSFGHLTYQEYLAGARLAKFNEAKEVAKRLGDPWWSKPLETYASTIGDLAPLVDLLSNQQIAIHVRQLKRLVNLAALTSIATQDRVSLF